MTKERVPITGDIKSRAKCLAVEIKSHLQEAFFRNMAELELELEQAAGEKRQPIGRIGCG